MNINLKIIYIYEKYIFSRKKFFSTALIFIPIYNEPKPPIQLDQAKEFLRRLTMQLIPPSSQGLAMEK